MTESTSATSHAMDWKAVSEIPGLEAVAAMCGLVNISAAL
jgi:hypothetical protein